MPRSSLSARAGSDRTSLYQEITYKIIAELEAGGCPGCSPGAVRGAGAARDAEERRTGRRYSGINVLILWGAVVQHGFSGQSWLTFRQALGARRPRPQGRARHDRGVSPTASSRRRARRARRAARRRPAHSVPQALHRLQHRPVRGLARGAGRGASSAAGPHPAAGGGADRASGADLRIGGARPITTWPATSCGCRRRRPISSR